MAGFLEKWRTNRAERDEAERVAWTATSEGPESDGATYARIKAERQAFADQGGTLRGGKTDARDLAVEKGR
jgi:hypothetical protein